MDLRFTVLVDDSSGNEGCGPSRSFGVDRGDHLRVLFDTGQGTKAMENARWFGLELAEIDVVAMSQGHNDHARGLHDG